MLTKIGKGEGSLNLIEWAAYSDPSFAKQVREADRLHDPPRRTPGSSNEMVALMRTGGGGGGGQYDLVSASGDASLRLIYGGDVQPVERPNLIPAWKNFLPAFKSPAHNTVNGVHYGVSRAVGAEHAALQHAEGEAGTDRLGRRSTAGSTRAS